ncbi:uncharacterized protein ruthe_03182 [Rubellimicrobium thermophilum DSM 16684]|uniref:Stress-induced acidophilic repeat motif-containing protein n=1 Tax=Rubellimicrobium thermophilum DSM 16684 TaxID=1123069 RepID=S9QMP5_9RHOB|nr:uncharacterized protein ruthe_03182 [Rubellimicrobium thermophilum DSM 16684]
MDNPGNTPRAPRGFAAMDPEKQRAIASKGGKGFRGQFPERSGARCGRRAEGGRGLGRQFRP